jgi:hypothetical protein
MIMETKERRSHIGSVAGRLSAILPTDKERQRAVGSLEISENLRSS